MTSGSIRSARGRGGPSMTDVARRAGVAVGTVSNVLNNPAIVSEATQAKVMDAIRDLGFVRNSAARALVAGTTNMIGLILLDIGNSFFVDIARGVDATTTDSGLRVVLANSDVDQARQDSYLELFDEARAEGVILAPLDGPLDVAHVVQSHGRPVVLVNVPAIDEGMCSVIVNEELGGYLAARHLIDQGARKLTFLGGPFRLTAISKRLAGVRRAVDEAVADLVVVETGGLNVGDGRRAGIGLMENAPGTEGVVCASDTLAIGVIQSALEMGVRVPDHLLVIGYDDNHLASESAVPVSTIRQPGREMGEVATRLLIDEIREGATHRHRAFALDPQLIVRRSSQRI